jgi:RsiW-degrading membrane proteinase PrsW (M82 family)
MLISLLAVSAVVPSALLVWYFHARDAYPEPPRVLWTTFGLGVLTVFPILIIGYPLQHAVDLVPDPFASSLLGALFVAAIPEELMKLLVLLGYNMRSRAFDEPMDGIVYGVVASLGFATLENVLFVFGGGLSVAVSRAFTAVPLHAFVGAIMGYYVGQAWRLPAQRTRYILLGYGFAVLLHMLYDFPLMAMAEVEEVGTVFVLGLCTLAVLFICWRWTLRLVRRLRKEQLAMRIAPVPAIVSMSSGMLVFGENNNDGISQSDLTPPDAHGAPAGLVDEPKESDASRLRRRITGIIVSVVGGLVASFGGMVTLGLTLAFLIGLVRPEHVADVIIGGIVSGIAPLGIGAFVFRKGVRHMNMKSEGRR